MQPGGIVFVLLSGKTLQVRVECRLSARKPLAIVMIGERLNREVLERADLSAGLFLRGGELHQSAKARSLARLQQ